jgi:hypothetical protein
MTVVYVGWSFREVVMAWIEQVGRRSWRVRYRAGGGCGSVAGFASRTAVVEYLEELRAEQRRGRWLDPAGARMCLGEWVERWIDTIDVEDPYRGELSTLPAAAHSAALGRGQAG